MPAGFAIRAGDLHIGHASPTPNPFHKTPYLAQQMKVYAVASPVIRLGDNTACGDIAVGCSSKVFCVGKTIHRVGDATSGHGSWVPNAAGVSSNIKVFVGG